MNPEDTDNMSIALASCDDDNPLTFYINGQLNRVNASTVKHDVTLNYYIRNVARLTGTKYMCLEGGCGSCVVTALIKNPRTNEHETLSVNSCLVSLLSCEGWHITTVEGLGNRYDGYHPIQKRIVEYNGTQCGFCTPGMVMTMFGNLQAGRTTKAQIENSFGGNICRCTGYRSILEACKTLASDRVERELGEEDTLDIEDFVRCCKTDENGKQTVAKCQEKCGKSNVIPRMLSAVQQLSRNWIRVTTVADIFAVFHDPQFAYKSYELVAGNTGKAVYPDLAKKELFIDISNVAELKTISENTTSLILGANCTLIDTMETFKVVSQRDDNFRYLSKLVEHLDLVATVAVRNIGTLAGNLSVKHAHHEFPSDIFLLLETIGAKVIIYDGENKHAMLPSAYLGIDMYHQIILNIELPPISAEFKLETYKIMTRAQNALAMVNAGFLFKLNALNTVEQATIVYGGIQPSFIHAKASESYVKGKLLFNNANMQILFAKLNSELKPTDVIPNASPKYRKGLAIALMYKFILSIAPTVTPRFKSGGEKLIRAPVSRGVQDFSTNTSLYPMGQPITKLEAADQASGAAKYVTDIDNLPGQMHCAFVLGQARTGSVLMDLNAEDALALPGVEAFLQASDVPGNNSFMALSNPFLYFVDEPIFLKVGEEIKFFFQPVGMILAKTREIALEAVDLVRVTFKHSTVSPLLTIQDVLNHGDSKRVTHQDSFVPLRQDATAPIKITGTFITRSQYHYHMELQVANVVPDDDGGFIVHSASQWMASVQYTISKALNIASNKLTMITKRIGGTYGAKVTRAAWTSCAATLAALKFNRPVKFYLSLPQNMKTIGKRDPFLSKYEVGVFPNGLIGYLNNDLYHDVGAYENWQLLLFANSVYMNTYKTDTFQYDTYQVRTDIQPPTSARAPGSVEGVAILETIMDQIAFKTNVDPIDVRLINLDAVKNPLLIKLVNDCAVWSDYRNRRAEIETFNAHNRWRKKGIAITCMAFDLIFVGTIYVQVSVYQDGTVQIMHGGVEFGQGINTKAAQTAAFLFGIDIKMVTIKATDTFNGPSQIFSAGSATTEGVCMALITACGNLKTRIDAAGAAGTPPATDWNTKVQYAYANGVSLTENQSLSAPGEYTIYGVVVSQVVVDILTGKTIIERVDLMEDCGDSMNPAIDIGQCEGAFTMGIGLWMTEEVKFNEEGELKTINTWTYHPPGARDIPVEFNVKFPKNIPNPLSPFHNKATTEPPICLAVSIPLAIRWALKSARFDADIKAEPFVEMDGPTTVEFTFLNALNDYKQYKL